MAYDTYPAVDGVTRAFPPEVRAALAAATEFSNLKNGVTPLTTAQRDALAGANLWDGRIILNTTTHRLNRYDSSVPGWLPIADFSEVPLLTAAAPAALGSAAVVGVATASARADHVHAGLTTATPQTVGTGAVGTATTAARADHVHDGPPFQSYTPTKTGFTVSSEQSFYQVNGKMITWHYNAVLNAAVSANMAVQLPVNFARVPTATNAAIYGEAIGYDVSAATFFRGGCCYNAINQIRFVKDGGAPWSGSVPFIWASPDQLAFTIEYESV